MAIEQYLGQTEGALDAALNDVGDLRTNMSERNRVAGMESPSFLGTLTQPRNLIALALAAAGGLSGSPGLQQAGLGLGAGVIEGSAAAPDEFQMKQQKRIEELSALIEKQQRRITDLLTSQPELFVGPEGENLVPEDDWAYLLGTNTPINPAAMVSRIKHNQNTKTALGVASDLLTSGIQTQNPELAAAGLRIINTVNELGWSDDQVASLAIQDPTSVMRRLEDLVDPASLLEAVKQAQARGLPITHPDIMSLLSRKTESTGWKLETLDDQIKMDAYTAFQWFQKDWMVGQSDIDGVLVPNRLMYERDPIKAFEFAFRDQPMQLAAIKKIFPATAQGDEYNKERVRAMLAATAGSERIAALMGSAVVETNPAVRMRKLYELAQSIDTTTQAALGHAQTATSYNHVRTVGERYKAQAGWSSRPEQEREGATIISLAIILAEQDGVEYRTLPMIEQRAYEDKAFSVLYPPPPPAPMAPEPAPPAADALPYNPTRIPAPRNRRGVN